MIREINTKLNSFEIFTIFRNEHDSFILDSAMDKEKLGRYSFISSQPFKVLKYKDTDENPLEVLKEELHKYRVVNDTNLPFVGGAVGYLSYDLGNYIENLPRTAVDDIEMPDMYFGFYNHVIVIDHLVQKTYIATPNIDIELEEKIIDDIEQRILKEEKKGIDSICYEEKEVTPIRLKSNFTKEEFKNAVQSVREYIRQGDIYQANLTQRFSGETELTSFELYRDLRRFSPAPFGAFLNFEDAHILSNSPEKAPEEDVHLSIDIGRISKTGSVKVPELFVIEPYANVNHLVSTVVGELKDDKDATDVIKATFPGGSITGAPKIRAMEIIDELEPTQRNVYTGSIGYIGFNGDMDFNIAIRTIIKNDKKVYFQVGGGMTWDSDPDEEYQETLDKAKSIMKALRGYYEE